MRQNYGNEKSPGFGDPMVLFALGLLMYLSGWMAWYALHTEISMGYTYVRYAQLWVFHALGSVVQMPGLSSLHEWVQRECQPRSLFGACTRDFSTMTWSDISESSFVMNLVLVGLLVVACIRMFLRVNALHPKLRFTKNHSLRSFVQESKPLYPHLRLFAELDLISQPLDHPVFGMSLTSRQFTVAYGLVAGWKEEADGSFTPSINREKAASVYRDQLGKHWTKSTELSSAETMLIAIAIPRVAATNSSLDDVAFKCAMNESRDLIDWCWAQFIPPKKGKGGQINEAWLRPQIDLTRPRQIIAKYIGHAAVQKVVERHAFSRTVIFGLIMEASRMGVFPPADMRWLRFYDRGLWYFLQTIGRQAAFAEAAGVLSHYLYEARAGVALAEPQVDKAVTGLEIALANFKFLAADKDRYEASQKSKDSQKRYTNEKL